VDQQVPEKHVEQQLLIGPLGAVGTCPQLCAGGVVEEAAEVNPGALHLCGDVTLLHGRSKGHVVCAT